MDLLSSAKAAGPGGHSRKSAHCAEGTCRYPRKKASLPLKAGTPSENRICFRMQVSANEQHHMFNNSSPNNMHLRWYHAFTLTNKYTSHQKECACLFSNAMPMWQVDGQFSLPFNSQALNWPRTPRSHAEFEAGKHWNRFEPQEAQLLSGATSVYTLLNMLHVLHIYIYICNSGVSCAW